MPDRVLEAYSDYKSPYAFLAKDPARDLAREFGLRLNWLPLTLDIPSYLDHHEARSARNWRKVKYAYMDCRRMANERGLVLYGPKTIFDSRPANIGLLYAASQGEAVENRYHDRVFERFFRRDFDPSDAEAVAGALADAGADVTGWPGFLAGEGNSAHAAIVADAQRRGVFGVPTFVWRDELFFGGDRLFLLRERLIADLGAPA